MKNELVIFEGNNIEMIIGENEKPMFELYAVGMALGYVRPNAKGVMYAYKSRIDKVVANADIELFPHGVHKYLSLDGIRKLITLSNTSKKRSFIEWLQKEGYIDFKEVFKKERKETVFFDILDKILKPMGYTLQQQVVDGSYRLDGYIKELDLVIEYDENGHSHYNKYKEADREMYIRNKYCNLIRLTDNKDLYTNIGLVMNKIIKIA